MRKKTMSLLPVIILALLVSCDGGGESSTSQTTSFYTVSASASYEEGVYEADDEVMTDTTGDGNCDTMTYFADDITITILSTIKDGMPVAASGLNLLRYTVAFVPFENSPAVPSKSRNLSMYIAPGGSTDIPIRIIDQEDKIDLLHPLNQPDYDAFVAAGLGVQYEYTVVVTLTLNELSTGITKTVQVDVPVYYYDIDTDDCD